MKKTAKEIKSTLEIDNERVSELADSLDDVLAIKSVLESDGGKLLIETVKDSCARALNRAVQHARAGEERLVLVNILDYAAGLSVLSRFGDVTIEESLRDLLDETVRDIYESTHR